MPAPSRALLGGTMIGKFKARLIAIPKVRKKEGSEELIEYGTFTLNKKYKVYSIFTQPEYTIFLVADDEGVFRWISTAIFRA